MPAGFQPPLPSYQEACFVLDPNAGLTDGNLWKDSGPHGLHVTPVNFVAPNYGISRTSKGLAYITFNGTTQRGELPLQFYDIPNLPTTELTMVVAAYHRAPVAGGRIFYCRDAVATNGFYMQYASADRCGVSGQAGALVCYVFDAVGVTQLTSNRRVSVYSMRMDTLGLRFAWQDTKAVTSSVATTGPAVTYDPTVIPTVGSTTGGAGQFFDGNLYHFSIWPRIFSDREARAFSQWLGDGAGA